MSHHPDNIYRVVNRVEATKLVLGAEKTLNGMGLPEWFLPETLARIHQALESRVADGLPVDVTSQTEVGGLVSAAMGDNDHLGKEHQALAAYTVGMAQTTVATVQVVRNMLGQHFYDKAGA